MGDRDLYEVLGVSRDASQEDIKKAYRRLARSSHPDVNHSDPEAERRFKEINLAYQTLSDPARRRQYDMFGGEGLSPDMFGFTTDMGDIFEAFFGASPFSRTRQRRRTGPRRGDDLQVVVDLSFEEAAFGVAREIRVEALEACERCGGVGAEPGTHPSRCSGCGGTGEVSDVRRSVFGTVMSSRPCPRCRGTGMEIASPCTMCRAEGRVAQRREVTVEVPAGISDGMQLRMEGRGDGGVSGGPHGDLFVTVRVRPHEVFERRGPDLAATLEVPVSMAMLGGEVEIETLEGPARVKVPAGTRAGHTIRVKGGGLPHLGRRGKGDLYLEVDLEIPKRLGKDERAAVERLAELRGERPEGPIPRRLHPRD